MSPRVVYRIEREGGQGPFRGNWASYRKFGSMPLPSEDGIHDVSHEEIFGFRSKAHFLKWVPFLDRVKLKFYGFRLHRYAVPQGAVREGREQVVFQRDAAINRENVRF